MLSFMPHFRILLCHSRHAINMLLVLVAASCIDGPVSTTNIWLARVLCRMMYRFVAMTYDLFASIMIAIVVHMHTAVLTTASLLHGMDS